jgi:hypothetical protein
MDKEINMWIWIKYWIYGIILNPIAKIFFYLLVVFHAIVLKGIDPFLIALFIIPIILFIETIITILINPELKSKQNESIKKLTTFFAALSAIPFIAILFKTIQLQYLVPISGTLIALAVLIQLEPISEKMWNFNKKMGNKLFLGLIFCILISFFHFGKINDSFLITVLLFTSIHILIVRITRIPNFFFSHADYVENYSKIQKRHYDDFLKYKENIFSKKYFPYIVNNKLYFKNSKIIDKNENSIYNKILVSKINDLVSFKENISSFNKRLRKNSNKILVQIIISLFFDTTHMHKWSRWIHTNYNKLPEFRFKSEEDKQLHKNDVEMNTAFNNLGDMEFNIILLSKMYEKLPSDFLLKLIREKANLYSKYAENKVLPLLKKREKLVKRSMNKAGVKKQMVEKHMKRFFYNAPPKALEKSIENMKLLSD